MSDHMSAKLAKMIYSTLSSGENLGGWRLVRGYDLVQKHLKHDAGSSSKTLKKKKSATINSAMETMAPVEVSLEPDASDIMDSIEDMDSSVSAGERSEITERALRKWMDRGNHVKHLVFVVHG
jgi:hypothetical protein